MLRIYARTLLLGGSLLVSSCTMSQADETASVQEAVCSPGISTLCDYAICNSTQCNTDADCSNGQLCSRRWNQDLEWQTAGTAFGHCMSPTPTFPASNQLAATNALQADLCTLPTPADYSMGVVYQLPPNGDLRLDDPDGDGVAVTIDHRTILEGRGAVLRLDVTNGSAPEYDNDVAESIGLEVVVDLQGNPPSPTQHAAWSSIRDVTIRATDYSNAGNAAPSNSSAGIAIHAHGTRLQNVRTLGFNFNVLVEAAGGAYNANDFRFDSIVSSGAHSYAVWIKGADSNTGLITQAEFPGNVGVRDSSFLGNTWIATHFEGNTSTSVHANKPVSMWLDGSASNSPTMVGTYVESGDPAIELANNSAAIFVGGNGLRDGILPWWADRVGFRRSHLVFKHKSNSYEVQIPGFDGNAGSAIAVQHRPTDYSTWELKVCHDSGTSGDFWGWYQESGCSKFPIKWRTSGVPADPDRGEYWLGTAF